MSLRRYALCAVAVVGTAIGSFTIAIASAQPPEQNGAQRTAQSQGTTQAPQGTTQAAQGNAQATQGSARATQGADAQSAEALRGQRLGNRAGYFGDRARIQLEEWITRNKVTPYQAGGSTGQAAPVAPGATAQADSTVTRPAPRAPAPSARIGVDVAAGRTAIAPPQVARYGYSAAAANTAPDTWFYDYYSYSPTYYYAAPTSVGVYNAASRYHDFNQDGIYDAVTVVRNPAQSGSFETYDRIDFVSAVDDRNDSLTDTIRSASRRTATGTIDRIKLVRVNGGDNLVVRVNTSINNPGTLADLGGVDRWPAGTVRDGDVVSVSGPVEEIGDRPIIIAETVKLNTGPDVQIRRFAPGLEGQVVDVMQAEVLNRQHTLAVLDTGSSRQIIDLGPTELLKFKLEPGAKIVAHGVPVQFQNYSVVLVDRVALDGQDVVIERWR